MLGSSSMAAQMTASQEGLSSRKLVNPDTLRAYIAFILLLLNIVFTKSKFSVKIYTVIEFNFTVICILPMVNHFHPVDMHRNCK
jgi:hypothetical protein